MTCSICDQKAANCDCTKYEKQLFDRVEDLEFENEELKQTIESLRAQVDAAGEVLAEQVALISKDGVLQFSSNAESEDEAWEYLLSSCGFYIDQDQRAERKKLESEGYRAIPVQITRKVEGV